ncbi:MAG TPA: glycosyltransferase family 39 protein [Caldilinea sp.]|nr:glycosyltransferase family 39 protein [Caldilinea sp.]
MTTGAHTLARTAWHPTHRARVLMVCLLAFGLATFRLDFQSLWYDEGVTAAVAHQGLAELTRWTANDIQPPLYYYVVAVWGQGAGWSEWALRFPTAWFATLTAPLLAALTLRLSRSLRAALLAALFAALHPLLVYYAQEARMYAQLTTLGVLAAYLLLRLADDPAPAWWRWGAFVAVAVAAVYTHYFAIFLLIGLAAAFVVDLLLWSPRLAARRKLWRLLGAGALVLLLYTPWLRAIFSQLRGDRSYWEGALKLHEAFADIAISFTSGETVFEWIARWLLLGYGLVTVIAVARLWRGRAAARRTLLYAGCWLLTPVVAVLLLALAIPKFNARYVMEALPGLLLIWAGGFGMEDEGRGARGEGRVARGAIILLLLGFAYGVGGWFFHPAFSKDQWRQLTEFLRPRLAEDEIAVLVSGHAWPVWEYYAPDLPVVRLPALEILDVDAVLDFAATGPVLRDAFADESGRRGAWLINWQDEVVDPNGITPIQLELSGREKGQSATFAGLTLRRFTGLRPYRFVDAPPIDAPTDVAFGDQVMLRGYKVVNNGDLLLFWERLPGAPEPAPDLGFVLQSATAARETLATLPGRRLAGYTYPFARWQPGEIVTAHVRGVDWLNVAAPQPGRYRFSVRVYDVDDAAATPLLTTDGQAGVEIGPVEVVID